MTSSMALGFALLMSVAALAAAEPLPVPEGLLGRWQGQGEVRGMSSRQTMEWKMVLGGSFAHLRFDNRMQAPDGAEILFQARAYYRSTANGVIEGYWFDSRGVSFPLAGRADDTTVHIDWGTEATELGRTTYRLTADGLEVIDEVRVADGEWRAFGRTHLSRAPIAAGKSR